MVKISRERVVVEAPASTANLGPGFDVFGLALEGPRDRVTITVRESGISLSLAKGSREVVPLEPEKNTAGRTALGMLRAFGISNGLSIELHKGIPVGVGLGGSAASAAAVAYGLNQLFELKLKGNELVGYAAKGEAASAGTEHADNVSASLLGGFTIVRAYKPLDVISITPPEDLRLSVAIPLLPKVERKTEKLRSVLPKAISIRKLVHNVGNAASLAVAFARSDLELIGRAIDDAVVEPARAAFIPGYREVKSKALRAGACGVAISGAGPAMVGFVDRRRTQPSKVAEAMKEGFLQASVEAEAFVVGAGGGATILKEG